MVDFITTSDGCRIAYQFDGPEGAPTLLLSNSLGTAMEMWAPQIPTLIEHFRVLRYDSRGHGRSGVPEGAYSMDRLGRDVIELLDALEIPNVSFCGLSKGGMIGQWLGIRVPHRLERLILANTSPFMGPPSDWDTRIAQLREGGMAAIVDAVLGRWFTAGFHSTRTKIIDALRAQFEATDLLGYSGCCAAIRDMDMRPLLPLITTPTLVIGGSEDPATPPSHSKLLADLIPGAALCMLAAAHLSNIEQPSAFGRLLLSYLTAGDL
jgi:3-oxoadipate enol-lactonase